MRTTTASNTVLVLRDGAIVARFVPGSEKGKKNPASQAEAFLLAILGDESHELHAALKNGELTRLAGHENTVTVAEEVKTVTVLR